MTKIVVDRELAFVVALHLLRFELRRPALLTVLASLMDKYKFESRDRVMVEAVVHSQTWIRSLLAERGTSPEDPDYDAVLEALLRDSIAMIEEVSRAVTILKNTTDRLTGRKD